MEAILYDKLGNAVARVHISRVRAVLYLNPLAALTPEEVADAVFLRSMKIVPEPIRTSVIETPRRFDLVHVGEDAVYREA